MGSMVTFQRPDGNECRGYYVEPAGGSTAPGIVVIQEWWGLNDQIKGVADRLAATGYRALVPDLYRGKASLDVKEAEHLMNSIDFGEAAAQDLRGSVQYLKQSSAKVGIVGFCMGGALTLLSVVSVPEANAAVVFYGFPPIEYIDASRIEAPIQGHFAVNDAFFPIQQVDAIEKKLQEAHVKVEFHRYKAQHAFANETAIDMAIPTKYDPAAANLAWQRTIEFLRQNLQ